MEFLTDVEFLSRLQFTLTVLFHYLFVPCSIGIGLFVGIAQTRAYKTKDPADVATARFWVRVFALTFTVGVATGITMEFSFGTNWADYARFVGDIFGAPLAAEALLAFFLESTFLGVLIFGRGKVSEKFYVVSAWLVWVGSLLSALWIIIANSWMQTPSGYEVVETESGLKAVLTDFAAAVFNAETIPTYLHTALAIIIFGSFVALAFAAFYHLRGRNSRFVETTLRTATVVALIATVLMMPAAHMQAKTVADEQPTKLAAMEGQYETEAMPMYLFGYVDTDSGTVYGVSIPGLTSFLASGDFTAEYAGLNDLEDEEEGSTPDGSIVQVVFQSYHIMIVMMGVICLGLLLALILTFTKKLRDKKWPWAIMCFVWIAPLLAIESGWMTAEFGRQPWLVYGELKTAEGVSAAVTAPQLIITIVLFVVVYLLIFVAFVRLLSKFVKEGPEHYLEQADAAAEPAIDVLAAPEGETADGTAEAEDGGGDEPAADASAGTEGGEQS